ncbi:MAG: tRNA epoxyqueuosine(34) reductase QueG [Anaerolineales bacterium]|nr:MAG: tRNA epoxyqueuosine(34) reductase QueG [Anaerolineales bacterium]
MNLTQVIKKQARSLGFSLVGVTGCDPVPHVEVFQAWLAQGRCGEMAYLNSERSRQMRAHPGLLLPGCRSILVLATRYLTPSPLHLGAGPNHQLHGRIAAYAWGEDYHEVLPGRLRALVEYIEGQVGHAVPNRCYTDTGPILERELAQRAGLGWIGKNTSLISPSGGSYYLLAEVLLGLELEPDPPVVADRCGTCQRCVAACPTACILPDRTLDARRCISYLTIELKGSIPPELRTSIQGWVFGCDVCQQVCPWNRFAAGEESPLFDHRLADSSPDLLTELGLSNVAFNRKYRHSPLSRTKRRGYLRNISVALGNLRDNGAVPALTEVIMHEPEALVRSHAAWALGRIRTQASEQALKQALDREADVLVISEIHSALESIVPNSNNR